MKERLFCLVGCLGIGIMSCLADRALVMVLTDSTEVVCALNNQPQMQFAQDSVTLTDQSGLVGQWNFAAVASWHFAEITNTNDVQAEQAQIRIEEGKIVVSGSKSRNVAVYDVSGRLIAVRDIVDDAVSLDLSGFTSGVYLLTVGNNSIKFLIR